MKPGTKTWLFGAVLGVFLLPVAVVRAQENSSWRADLENAEKFFLQGDKEKSETFYQQALNEVPDDTARATVINQKGVAQNLQHQFLDAQKSFSDALELRKKALGENDAVTLQTMSNLALATYKSGEEVAAEKLYLECIERKRKIAPKSESLAKSLTNLANLYTDERNCAEAKKLYLEAAEIDTALFGSNNAQVAVDLYNVGVMSQKCQETKEALHYLDKANTIFASLGDKYGQVKALHYSGISHGDLKNYEKASDFSLRALALHQDLKGKDHPDTIVHILAAGDALAAAGKNDDAEKLYQQALRAARLDTKASSVRLTECNLALAQLYKKENKTDDAEQCFKKALIHYENLSKKEKRDLYELPLAYSQLLKELKQNQESEHLNHKYLHVYAPDKAGR